jgi:ABC-type molybdenum transport system ATPase subunit/photorepair protein PhrA
MGIKEPKVKTGHPKLLIIDEPQQQKMGRERYLQVLNLFGKLAIENKEDIQILIATDTKDIPSNLKTFGIELSSRS